MEMERSQKRMLPPASGVTVIVDLDLDNEEQKLTIHSKSKQFSLTDESASQKNMMARAGNNSKEDPSTSASTSSSPSTSTSGLHKPKRMECIGNHFPELMPDKMAKSCLCCSSVTAFSPRKPNGKLLARHQTRYWCPDCKTPLCISPRPCFKRYHTVEEYFKYVDTTVRTGPLVSSTAPMYPSTNEFPREYPKQIPFSDPRQNPFVPPIQNPFGDPRQNPFVTPPNMKTEMMPPMNPMNMTSNMKTEMMPPMNMAPYPPIVFPHHESA